MTPPRNAEIVATMLIADASLRDAVLGDLTEEHARLQNVAPHQADRWYWSQIIRSAIPFSFLAVSRGGWRGWLRLAAAIAVGYVTIVAMVITTGKLVVGASMTMMSILSLTTGVISGIVAGFAAAIVGGRSPFAPAIGLGALCAAFALLLSAFEPGGAPLWYQLGLVIIVFPSVIVGALLRAGQLSRPNSRSA